MFLNVFKANQLAHCSYLKTLEKL